MINHTLRSSEYKSGTHAFRCYLCCGKTDGWLCEACAPKWYFIWHECIYANPSGPLLEPGDAVPEYILQRIMARDTLLGMRLAIRDARVKAKAGR